jgi:hypothetical protein
VKNRLMAILIAALTLAACGGSDSATLSPSEPADNCTTTLASPITTSKGSKDVRNELNEMFRQLMCRTSELDAEVVKADSARQVEKTRIETALGECLKSTGMCLSEYEAEYANRNPSSGNRRSDLEWTLHDAWLNSWRMLYNLSKIYPDSVQPKFLAYIIGWGEYVDTCSAKRQWCQPDKK